MHIPMIILRKSRGVFMSRNWVRRCNFYKSNLTKKEWNRYFTGHWNLSGEKQDKHLEMFLEGGMAV